MLENLIHDREEIQIRNLKSQIEELQHCNAPPEFTRNRNLPISSSLNHEQQESV